MTIRTLDEIPGNAKQRATVELLMSRIEVNEVVPDEYSDALVFDGTSVDGPAVGYIEPNGEVSWICGW